MIIHKCLSLWLIRFAKRFTSFDGRIALSDCFIGRFICLLQCKVTIFLRHSNNIERINREEAVAIAGAFFSSSLNNRYFTCPRMTSGEVVSVLRSKLMRFRSTLLALNYKPREGCNTFS
ncbi:MAG: hypothetical protein PUC14_04230 [Bacteroidales bacterium]|nr:hypothetical protein [Bacteroidales bacterium]